MSANSLEGSSSQSPIDIVVIAGIRAQFMKLAALQRAIGEWNTTHDELIRPIYVNSGQHYDDALAGQFIRELGIHLDVDLTQRLSSRRPIDLLGNMIIAIYDAFGELPVAPHWVIVFGDANTTMAASIAAAKRGLRIVHVEAGLRSRNLTSPEEQNTIVADHLATVHFASSRSDTENLRTEGLHSHVYFAGDLIFDLVRYLSDTLSIGYAELHAGQYILATIHREENVVSDNVLRNLVHGLQSFTTPILFIAHPRTRRRIEELGLDTANNVVVVETLPYRELLSAIKGCRFLVTDSGALQRESYYLGKRCLIVQKHPFWPTLTRAGIHRTVKPDVDDLKEGVQWMEGALASGTYPSVDDFGDGHAGQTILDRLAELTLQCEL